MTMLHLLLRGINVPAENYFAFWSQHRTKVFLLAELINFWSQAFYMLEYSLSNDRTSNQYVVLLFNYIESVIIGWNKCGEERLIVYTNRKEAK